VSGWLVLVARPVHICTPSVRGEGGGRPVLPSVFSTTAMACPPCVLIGASLLEIGLPPSVVCVVPACSVPGAVVRLSLQQQQQQQRRRQ
jgi:hypothetical protein